ncbi:MAG: hypothetical protein R2720_02680 [Candidatus Nanopelagicales bacterium]
MHRRAADRLSREWLSQVSARPEQVRVIGEDVRARLAALPTPLAVGYTAADAVLGVLPDAVSRRVLRLPVASEFARLVESLTTVSYFDEVDRESSP